MIPLEEYLYISIDECFEWNHCKEWKVIWVHRHWVVAWVNNMCTLMETTYWHLFLTQLAFLELSLSLFTSFFVSSLVSCSLSPSLPPSLSATSCTIYCSWVLAHNIQNIPIPTMDTGAEVAKRFYKELTDIQVSIYQLYSTRYFWNYLLSQ